MSAMAPLVTPAPPAYNKISSKIAHGGGSMMAGMAILSPQHTAEGVTPFLLEVMSHDAAAGSRAISRRDGTLRDGPERR